MSSQPENDHPRDLPPPRPVQPVVVPRWIQLVALPLGVLALWQLVRAAGTVLLIFLFAAVIALILNPLVSAVQRTLRSGRVQIARGLAVLAVYSGFFLTLAVTGALLADPVTDQVETLRQDVPQLVSSANATLASLQEWLDARGIGIEIKSQGGTALGTLQRNILAGSGELVAFGQALLARTVAAGFAFILVLVISVYMLLYAGRIGEMVRSVMPAGDGTPEDDYPTRAQKAVFGYVRGQLLFSGIMGLSAGVSLWLFGAIGLFPDGQRYALFFGIFFGLMELIPYIGPVLGALPPILVALFDDPLTAVWVALLFLALQQLEGHVVAPQVFGHSLRINPLLVIFALLVGGELYGVLGAFLALPLAAMARETVLYLRRHVVLEPWGTAAPLPVTQAGPVAAGCPDCSAPAGLDDAYCRACGAALGPRVSTGG
jgi:predicted PurR-regulated permease PerM